MVNDEWICTKDCHNTTAGNWRWYSPNNHNCDCNYYIGGEDRYYSTSNIAKSHDVSRSIDNHNDKKTVNSNSEIRGSSDFALMAHYTSQDLQSSQSQ
jgi:hypothetical protein